MRQEAPLVDKPSSWQAVEKTRMADTETVYLNSLFNAWVFVLPILLRQLGTQALFAQQTGQTYHRCPHETIGERLFAPVPEVGARNSAAAQN